jgi:site-specific recombinase XerC
MNPMTTSPTLRDDDQPDDEQNPDRTARRQARREAKRARKTARESTAEGTDLREAMRAGLIAQGFDPLVVEAMLPTLAAPKDAYRVRQAVADAITALRQDLPRSEKTWAPYLQLLADGLPDMCPCPCPTCAVGPCPCAGGADAHTDTCAMPADELHTDCAQRYAGVPEMPVKKVARSTLAEAAWWVERRGLKRTVARNVKREQLGRPLLHSDGRGAREQFLQANRWMFSWLSDDDKVKVNPAAKLKLPPRQEAGARSLTDEEFLEVYGVAVSTGQDPALDGRILRHLLIQAVRRGALLDTTCGGLDVEGCRIRYWDQKKQTWRYRPTTRTHMADLLTHELTRGPRGAASPEATVEERRHGIPALTDTSPVFYARPVDTFDADGNFVSRTVRPITRKRIEGPFARIRRNLPWTERIELRCHDVRHTSGRIVFKAADQQAAKLHLAHDGGSTTDHYLKERLDELAKLKQQLFERPVHGQ